MLFEFYFRDDAFTAFCKSNTRAFLDMTTVQRMLDPVPLETFRRGETPEWRPRGYGRAEEDR